MMPGGPPPALCGWRPGGPEEMAAECPFCGHAAAVHAGTDACPVCVLLAVLGEFTLFTMRVGRVLAAATDPLAAATLGEQAIADLQARQAAEAQDEAWPPGG